MILSDLNLVRSLLVGFNGQSLEILHTKILNLPKILTKFPTRTENIVLHFIFNRKTKRSEIDRIVRHLFYVYLFCLISCERRKKFPAINFQALVCVYHLMAGNLFAVNGGNRKKCFMEIKIKAKSEKTVGQSIYYSNVCNWNQCVLMLLFFVRVMPHWCWKFINLEFNIFLN